MGSTYQNSSKTQFLFMYAYIFFNEILFRLVLSRIVSFKTRRQ